MRIAQHLAVGCYKPLSLCHCKPKKLNRAEYFIKYNLTMMMIQKAKIIHYGMHKLNL